MHKIAECTCEHFHKCLRTTEIVNHSLDKMFRGSSYREDDS